MESASRIQDGLHYSFAVEYNGPPLPYDLPRALPINVQTIPVAAVVSPVILGTKLSLPVVQPIIPTPDPLTKKFSRELKSKLVSPTSVIDKHHNGQDSESKELESVSEPTVSPTSVIAFDERTGGSATCAFSGEFSCSNYESGEFSDVVNSSRQLNSSCVSREHSNILEFSDSFDKSIDSSSVLRASNESVLSLYYPSSRVSSLQTEDLNSESYGDDRKPLAVAFCDIESDDNDEENFGKEEPRALPLNKGRKGACYRCSKGNRFTEKEVCLVCDAKYCSNCVLRAMGSMPEGRKCVTCIGFPIQEQKRGSLGKCSRMLKRLLNDLEVKQIMKTEKLCEGNRLPPEYVYVNGEPLSHEELLILQTCPTPPKKLKPGNYWYDKVSGLWGKEGLKPSKIISPHLNVGGPIMSDASSGNTQVFINGREITKVELRMLQLAGVQCAGNPHFWVNDDGSYQEEGQKNTKGYIWGTAGTRLLCAFLSLPVPCRSSPSLSGDQLYSLASRSVPDYFEQRILQKILLVGYTGSGSSTIFKQAKILYKAEPFSEDEQENMKLTIQTNVYRYLGILLEGRERFEEECLAELRPKNLEETDITYTGHSTSCAKTIYSIGPRFKAFSDWLLKTMVSGNLEAIFPASTREYAPLVEELWKDAAIQATYNRRSELETLPSVGDYFLKRAVEILRIDYEPSDLDVLYAEGVTSSNGLACVDFSFPQSAADDSLDSTDQHDSLLRYQLIRVHSRGLGEKCKWLEMFEDVGMVTFVVALSDYDQFTIDGTNKMLLTRKFFESIVTNPIFEQLDFLLILNKFDLFEERIERVPLTQCEWFDDFYPVVSRYRSTSSNSINHNPSLGQLGFHHVAVKFKRLYSSLTGKKLYVAAVKALDPNSVDRTLKYAREILKWGDERVNFSLNDDYSICSMDASSYSH